jgi:hypothetical protein
MIVIEGSDLVGKTTLAQALAVGDLKYKHYSRLPDSHDRMFHYLPDIQAGLVLDRFYMSEPVYASVRGEDTLQKPYHAVALDREVIAAGGVIVVVTADPQLIEERYSQAMVDSRHEMYDINQVQEANQLFYGIATSGGLNDHVFHVDLHFHCTKEAPFVSSEDIAQINYTHMQACLRAAYLRATREFPIPTRKPS